MFYSFTIGNVSPFIPVGCRCMHAPLKESRISRSSAPSLHSLALRSKEGVRQCVLSLARHYKAWCLLVEVSTFFEA